MESLDDIIKNSEDLWPLDRFLDKCKTLRFSPLINNYMYQKGKYQHKKLNKKAVNRIFKANLPPLYLKNNKIKNLHLGFIYLKRDEYKKAFDCFEKICDTEKDSMYKYALFSLLAKRLEGKYSILEHIAKSQIKIKEYHTFIGDSINRPIRKSNLGLYERFKVLFPFLKNKNKKTKTMRTYYKNISEALMEKAIKHILEKRHNDFKNVSESTNDVCEFSDKLLGHLFIIKKYEKNEGFTLEKQMLSYFKYDKNINIPKIIYSSKRKGIIVQLRENKLDFLTILEKICKINCYLKNTNSNYKGVEKQLNREGLKELEDCYGIFKVSYQKSKFWDDSYGDMQQNSNIWIKDIFEKLIGVLAYLHANTPYNLLMDREKTKSDYRNDIKSFCEKVEKLTNKELINFSQFKENYQIIIDCLSDTQKVLYKDSYLKNMLLHKYPHKPIQVIDFEKCCLAPAQLDLAQILNFGNFLDDQTKYKLVSSYIENFNFLVYNTPKIIKNEEEFKTIFNYACVHRNLLNFRSYSRFIEKGDTSKKTADYKRMSLENSIKALQKLISYEKNNISELKALHKDIKGIYDEIYK